MVTVSRLSETLSPCSLKKKKFMKEFFAAGVKQHEQQVVRQGQKWSLAGLGTAAVHPPVLGLKNEENPTETHSCKDSSLLNVGKRVQSDPSLPSSHREVAQ